MNNKTNAVKAGLFVCYGLLFRQALLLLLIGPGDTIWHQRLTTVYFFIGAGAYVALCIILKKELQDKPGRVGLVLLLLSAAGMLAASIFNPGQPDELHTSLPAAIHKTGEIIALMAIPIAAVLVNLDLALRNPAWAEADEILLWTSFAPFVGLAIFSGYLFVTVISKGQHVDSKILRHTLPAGGVFMICDIWAVILAGAYLKKVNITF